MLTKIGERSSAKVGILLSKTRMHFNNLILKDKMMKVII